MHSIYFGGGSYSIDEKQAEELMQWLEEVPNLYMYRIHIHSHTDNIGSKEFNQYLSEMRSLSTYELVKRFPSDLYNIIIDDFGEENPVYKNDSWSGRQRNRRVDVVLKKLES